MACLCYPIKDVKGEEHTMICHDCIIKLIDEQVTEAEVENIEHGAVNNIIPGLNASIQSDLDKAMKIINGLFHEETSVFDGTIYFSKGAGWISSCDHKEIKKLAFELVEKYK